ncbi:MAG: tetratricopeptide repeat protein [Sulfuricellaceae bacterium]|nr:tetratricopeptide repeat protein [Sulfuricellaceae bacterium]
MSLLLEALKRAEQGKQKNVLSDLTYEEADASRPAAAPEAQPPLPAEAAEETAFPTLELAEPAAETAPPASPVAPLEAAPALSLETLSLEPQPPSGSTPGDAKESAPAISATPPSGAAAEEIQASASEHTASQAPAPLALQADEVPVPTAKSESEKTSYADPSPSGPQSPSPRASENSHKPPATSPEETGYAGISPSGESSHKPPAMARRDASCETPAPPPGAPAATPTETPSDYRNAATNKKQRQAANILGATRPSPRRRTLLLSIAGAAILAVLGGSGYVYWQLTQASPSLAIAANPLPAYPQGPLPANPPQNPPPQAPAAAAPSAALSAAPSAPASAAGRRREAAPKPEDLAAIPDAPPSANKEAAFSIRRSRPSATVDPTLTRAYTAFMAGDLKTAKQDYSASLRQDANNPDALLGMAAIASKNGQREEAIRIYRRLLELDPRNASAQAGLLSLTADRADSVPNESRIKILLAQQPDSHFLYFTLGNLYAGQSRWAEAQQAFFHAYSKAPDNPDYLYNLAVSLDHLGQRPTALKFYRQALAASPGHPANFDLKLLQTRIQQLTASGASPGASP